MNGDEKRAFAEYFGPNGWLHIELRGLRKGQELHSERLLKIEIAVAVQKVRTSLLGLMAGGVPLLAYGIWQLVKGG